MKTGFQIPGQDSADPDQQVNETIKDIPKLTDEKIDSDRVRDKSQIEQKLKPFPYISEAEDSIEQNLEDFYFKFAN